VGYEPTVYSRHRKSVGLEGREEQWDGVTSEDTTGGLPV
jgi:hypothetical protein